MAQLVVEDGEVIQFRQRVGNTRENHVACELIVTDRRLVLTSVSTKTTGFSAFGVVGALASGLFKRFVSGSDKPQVTHSIRREQFHKAEVTGTRDVLIESTGTGYARQWFEISLEYPQHLVERIERWAAGHLEVVELPTAIIRK